MDNDFTEFFFLLTFIQAMPWKSVISRYVKANAKQCLSWRIAEKACKKNRILRISLQNTFPFKRQLGLWVQISTIGKSGSVQSISWKFQGVCLKRGVNFSEYWKNINCAILDWLTFVLDHSVHQYRWNNRSTRIWCPNVWFVPYHKIPPCCKYDLLLLHYFWSCVQFFGR